VGRRRRAAATSGAIGLRHFTVRLPTDAAVAEVVERVRAADIPVESTAGGHLVRDPAGNAMTFAIQNLEFGLWNLECVARQDSNSKFRIPTSELR
jgi:hypothetical protein